MSEEKNKERMGANFEKMIARVFKRIGFETKLNQFVKKKNGQNSEQDVIATKGNLKIVIQCKDYAKFDENKVEETTQKLIEDGELFRADTLILAIIGLKNYDKWKNYAKEKGVYLWDQKYWEKLQDLDLINLYKEIGKNLEIEEVLEYEKKEEEKKLKSLYDKIEDIEDIKERKVIFEQLEKLEFSDYTKREIQLKNIENEILIKKEKWIDEQTEGKIEDMELEEMFSMINKSNLNFNKKSLILDKIRNDIKLSKKSGRLIDVEKIKTFIEKQEEDVENDDWGDETHINLEKLVNKGQLSEEDKKKVQEEIKQTIGVSKKGYTESQKIKIERVIKSAILKRKLKKTLIVIGIWALITFILWRILF